MIVVRFRNYNGFDKPINMVNSLSSLFEISLSDAKDLHTSILNNFPELKLKNSELIKYKTFFKEFNIEYDIIEPNEPS
jgi:hypothetical protein